MLFIGSEMMSLSRRVFPPLSIACLVVGLPVVLTGELLPDLAMPMADANREVGEDGTL